MERLDRLRERRQDFGSPVQEYRAKATFDRQSASESVRYALGAMAPIDATYTQNTFAEGDRVKAQLSRRLLTACDFEYQGSVATDTHIKAYSDVDLLVLIKRWIWIDPPNRPIIPYSGSPFDDILDLRHETVTALVAAFPEATVDDTYPKAVKLEGGSLRRKIDVVPASWVDTVRFVDSGEAVYRGVKIFDKSKHEFIANTPFLHKQRIDEGDRRTCGGLRKAIRLMKSLKYDSDDRVQLSSYNISGIAYAIPDRYLSAQPGCDLRIVEACCQFCEMLASSASDRESILVPDGHRRVFGDGPGATHAEINAMTKELANLRADILNENAFEFSSLVEARVANAVAVN